jgi:hypothetical protein
MGSQSKVVRSHRLRKTARHKNIQMFQNVSGQRPARELHILSFLSSYIDYENTLNIKKIVALL